MIDFEKLMDYSDRQLAARTFALTALAVVGMSMYHVAPDGTTLRTFGGLAGVCAGVYAFPHLTHTIDRIALWWKTRGYNGE